MKSFEEICKNTKKIMALPKFHEKNSQNSKIQVNYHPKLLATYSWKPNTKSIIEIPGILRTFKDVYPPFTLVPSLENFQRDRVKDFHEFPMEPILRVLKVFNPDFKVCLLSKRTVPP